MEAKDRIICALDLPNLVGAHSLASNLEGSVGWFKVGLELFAYEGPKAVRELRRYGKIMLDLKLHDIPETISRTVKQCIDLGASMMTLHTSGGRKMMEDAANAAGGKIKLLGVTVLTSLDEKDVVEMNGVFTGTMTNLVHRRALWAHSCGLDGVVASPLEAGVISSALENDEDFLIVTPGIRPAGSDTQDQKRVATAKDARASGATHIVVGRPLRDAHHPREVAEQLARDMD